MKLSVTSSNDKLTDSVAFKKISQWHLKLKHVNWASYQTSNFYICGEKRCYRHTKCKVNVLYLYGAFKLRHVTELKETCQSSSAELTSASLVSIPERIQIRFFRYMKTLFRKEMLLLSFSVLKLLEKLSPIVTFPWKQASTFLFFRSMKLF